MEQRLLNSNKQLTINRVVQHLIDANRTFVLYALPNSSEIVLMVEANKTATEYFTINTFYNQQIKVHADVKLHLNDIEKAYEIQKVTKHTTFKPSPLLLDDEQSFKNYVQYIVNACKEGEIEKAVASGRKLIPMAKNADLGAIFCRSYQKYTNAFVHLSVTEFGIWIGATPELLIQEKSNQYFTTMSLAGTKKIEEQREWTQKEITEQAIVTSTIREGLIANNVSELFVSSAKSHQAGHLEHLKSDINFKSELPIDQLAKILHPTPAVGGFPRDKALAIIKHFEQDSRQCYTGFLGPSTKEHNALYVNLRCMQVLENDFLIYVGAGITKDSDPDAEWDEIMTKASTMTQIL